MELKVPTMEASLASAGKIGQEQISNDKIAEIQTDLGTRRKDMATSSRPSGRR